MTPLGHRFRQACAALTLIAALAGQAAAAPSGVYSNLCRRSETGNLTGAQLRIVAGSTVKLFLCDRACWPISTRRAKISGASLTFEGSAVSYDPSGKHPEHAFHPFLGQIQGNSLTLTAPSHPDFAPQTLQRRAPGPDQNPDLTPLAAPRCP